MATAESVKAKLRGLIDRANGVTGQTADNLTAAVEQLAAGYGQGGDAKTYTITLTVSGSFSLWCGGVGYEGLSASDNPGSITVTGEQCIAVFVPGSSGGATPGGCVGTLESFWLANEYGTLFIFSVSGDELDGGINITDY